MKQVDVREAFRPTAALRKCPQVAALVPVRKLAAHAALRVVGALGEGTPPTGVLPEPQPEPGGVWGQLAPRRRPWGRGAASGSA